MDLSDFRVLSFDCYGTLIDWETGILSHFRPWLIDQGIETGDGEILRRFGPIEAREEGRDPGAPYPEVLRRVYAGLATTWGLEPDVVAAARFGDSVGDWPAFPDSPSALAELQESHRLVILSNVDRASFRASQRRLGIEFEAVYTAQDIGSYKPDPRNFTYLLEAERAVGYERDEILHVAQSLYHDHVPATAAGLATCWIQRRSEGGDHGATQAPDDLPPLDFHFRSLSELAASLPADFA